MKRLKYLDLIGSELEQVEQKMRHSTDGAYEPLVSAWDTLLSGGGKRLRPALSLLASRFGTAESERVIAMAAAVETLHTATLVHDDVIDQSLLRRGNPTLNASWTGGATVLAGDFFFAKAAAFAAETGNARVITIFAQTLLTLCDGELRQAFSLRNWAQPKEDYYKRIYGKTSALFEAATECGAILAGLPETHIQALHDYGYALGMAFQIVDDILDFTETEQTLGKPAGSDLKQGTITLPVFYFLQEEEHHELLVLALERREGEQVLAEVVNLIRNSPAIEQARQEAQEFVVQAQHTLDSLPDTPYREAMIELADYVTARHS